MKEDYLSKHPMYLLLYVFNNNKEKNKAFNDKICAFFGVDNTKYFLYKKTENEFLFYSISFEVEGRLNFFRFKTNYSNHFIFASEEHLIDPPKSNFRYYLKSHESVFYNFEKIHFKHFVSNGVERETNKIKFNDFNSNLPKGKKQNIEYMNKMEKLINNSNANDNLKAHMLNLFKLKTDYHRDKEIFFEKIVVFKLDDCVDNIFQEDCFNV